MAHWFARIADAVFREYDRRIKRASLLDEYGAQHDDHAAPSEAALPGDHAGEDDGAVEIVNLPRGRAVSAEPGDTE